MDKSFLVRVFGFPATLIHGDPLVLDRWIWLKGRLPITGNHETLLDVGSGTGAFSIGASRRGYEALGLSWDERNQSVSRERAKICGAKSAKFEILDVRVLGSRKDLLGSFDYAICCETIEHIMDDSKLVSEMSDCLKPGGRLLLTTPYHKYRAITREDIGPFSEVESGWHVRRGYTRAMLEELCRNAGLIPEEISYCSGFFSQKTAWLMRILSRKIHPLFGWLFILPLRAIPPLFDPILTRITRWPSYSICLEAYKPRNPNSSLAG